MDEDQWLGEHVRMQTAVEYRKIKVDEAWLKLEQDAAARQELLEVRNLDLEERTHRLHEQIIAIEEKRLKLDKQRVELNATERRGMIEKTSKVLGVHAALAKLFSWNNYYISFKDSR